MSGFDGLYARHGNTWGFIKVRISRVLWCAAVIGALLPGTVRAADEIVIGASVPLSGPLAGFGGYTQWGYKRAVDEVNRAGGIVVDGVKKKVKLLVRDDKTNPNLTASNTENSDFARQGCGDARFLHSAAGECRRAGGRTAQDTVRHSRRTARVLQSRSQVDARLGRVLP